MATATTTMMVTMMTAAVGLVRRRVSAAPPQRHASGSGCCHHPLCLPARTIIVPKQLKAYGSSFSQSVGERSDHLAGHVVLQKLSGRNHSPLLSKPVKTRTVESFEDMLVSRPLREALSRMEITTPSPIQQTAIETVLQRKDCLLAAPHGEGKTLAYLLPLYQNMMRDRDVYKIPLRERRPRMVLLAPTREVVAQVQSVCATLDAATGLRSVSFTSRKRAKYHLSRMLKQTMPDVIIMDPMVVLRLIRARRLFLDDLRYVAVDEADVMLSSQHDHMAVHLLMKVQKRMMYKHLWPVQTQFVFSTAFVTRKLEYFIGKRFPAAVTCMRKQTMHLPAATLRHRFFAVRKEQHKLDVLIHLLKKHGNWPREILTEEDVQRAHTESFPLTTSARYDTTGMAAEGEPGVSAGKAVVPAGNREGDDPAVAGRGADSGGATDNPPTRQQLRYELESVRPVRWEHLMTCAAPFTCHVPRTVFAEGQRVIIFTRSIDACTAIYHRLRGAGFTCALLHAALPYQVRQRMFEDFASGRCNILVATDVASRGIDVHVDVVVNFDMPTNAVAYLARAGRTGRMGRLGRVYSLFTKQQGVIVSAVRAFLKKSIPLEGVSNWRVHMMTPRYGEWRTHRINALARSYVSMISTKTIPAHLERTYLRHNATWRPLFHPQTVRYHAGIPPRQQQRAMDRIMAQAVWFRRGQLARRKGGRAKFGSRDANAGVWNNIGGIATNHVANAAQEANPGGPDFGPPSGPPE